MDMKKVKKLNAKSTIGVFSPSEPITDLRVPKFNQGLNKLKEVGFDIVLGNNCLARTNYSAGTIEQRIEDIHDLLQNKSVDCLLASWGGKSCNQLVNKINYDLFITHRKAFLGFSDPCVLANHITAKTGLYTFYGPNVVGKLDETDFTKFEFLKESFKDRDILFADKNSSRCLKKGKNTGRLIGGNLSTFILGVISSDIPQNYYKGGILFWEDLGNPPQLIDQYMNALKNYGIFDLINGMIIGDFITDDPKAWKKTDPFDPLINTLREFKFPILYSPSFGHRKSKNPILPIGGFCELNSDDNTLILLEEVIE